MGVAAVTVVGNHVYAVLAGAGCSHGHPSEDNTLLRVYGNGTTAPLADLSNYLRSNFDSKDPAASDFEPDGVWYSLIHAFGGFYTIEPNHGLLVRVEHNGAIIRVADLIDRVTQIDPAHDGDKTFTSLTVHKGSFYIGTLGRIDTGFAGSVYRVSADGLRVEEVASGLHGVVGVAFDRRDRMYVLETTNSSFPPLSDPGAGRLLRVERDGSLTPLVTNLSFPTALIAGHRGEFYISNCGYHCDDLTNAPVSRPSLGAGQVLKVEIEGHRAFHGDNDQGERD